MRSSREGLGFQSQSIMYKVWCDKSNLKLSRSQTFHP
jgi:hypothetical protein